MKLTATLAAASLFLASCSHVYYIPNATNAPLLSQKGETNLNGFISIGADSDFIGPEVQFSTAVSNHFGIMADGFLATYKEQMNQGMSDSYEEKGDWSFAEFGLGYFSALDPGKKLIAEIYAGFGFGGMKYDFGRGDRSRVSLSKFFIQPSIGYKEKNFEAIFVPKLNWNGWKVKDSAFTASTEDHIKTELREVKNNPNFFTFQPSIIVRGGSEKVKAHIGLTFSTNDKYGHRYDELWVTGEMIETVNLNIGISLRFIPKAKK